MKEKVHSIPIAQLHPFKNHSFQVKDDEAMQKLADSILKHDVLIPALPGHIRVENMSYCPVIGVTGHVSWLDWKPCW